MKLLRSLVIMGWAFLVSVGVALFACPRLLVRIVTPIIMNISMLSILALTAIYAVIRVYRSGMRRP
jgi:hypothetical protein